jgi:hypothetical protein
MYFEMKMLIDNEIKMKGVLRVLVMHCYASWCKVPQQVFITLPLAATAPDEHTRCRFVR